MSEMTLKPNEKLDVRNILKDLDKYEPKRRGWTWRKPAPNLEMGPFTYHDVSEPLKQSVGLPPAKYFGDIDPQPLPVITTEIASGRFEDDIRRMRMAAWHGADHIMVIRHMGQSHIDGLMEGTPQGIGGVPITRKQVRAQRKALDLIEEEVGRPINYHSYVSGVAGPDVAVMFAEEGINGAHQDPQYNVLYRDINCVRSFVDACESKSIMAWAGMLQIDGAHNANATAREAWKVMPELIVQHAINSLFSERVGMKPENISLSTVPPTATPAPCVYTDLPYAVALRDICGRYKMRAQQNTKYICSSTREATVTHVLNMLISKLTSADIQSTITPDEGRNVPWHIYNIEAIDNAKQTLIGLDGLMEMVELKKDGPLREMARELKERACLFMEEIVEVGGYFNAVQEGFFVDSAKYPEPHHLSDAVLYKEFEEHPMVVVCGTVGEDEHSVGLREIINIKHGGIEKWGVKVHYLGTSVPVEKLVDAAVELNANAILASTIISHDNVHYKNMKRINELAVEKGIRDRVIIAAGGTQVIPDEAVKTGIDQGFGRDSHGIDVATFLAEEAMRRRGEL